MEQRVERNELAKLTCHVNRLLCMDSAIDFAGNQIPMSLTILVGAPHVGKIIIDIMLLVAS